MADISELKGQVLSRFQELTDDEVGILETLGDSPVGAIILKLLGPELNEIFSDDAPTDETEQMLASEESPDYRDEIRDRFGDRKPMDQPVEPEMRESFRMGKEPREIDFNRDRPSDMPMERNRPQDVPQDMRRDMPVDDMPQAMEREMASR